MESSRTILENQELLTAAAVKREINTAETAVRPVDNKQIDYLIEEFGDLTGSGKSMNGFYAETIRRLGVNRWVALAKTAQQEGKNPPRYFSWLLKNTT